MVAGPLSTPGSADNVSVGKEWVQKMFLQLDKDDKRYLTLDELVAYSRSKMLLLDFSEEKLLGMFEEAQSKNDGRLKLDELLRATSGRFRHRRYTQDWYRFVQTFFPKNDVLVRPKGSGAARVNTATTVGTISSVPSTASIPRTSRSKTGAGLGGTGVVRVKPKKSRIPPKEDPTRAPSKEEAYVNSAVKSQLSSATDDLGPAYPTVSFEAQKRFSALVHDMETRSNELDMAGKPVSNGSTGVAKGPRTERTAPPVMPAAFARLQDQETAWTPGGMGDLQEEKRDRFVLAFHTEDSNTIQTRVALDQGAMREPYQPPAETVFRGEYRPCEDGKPEFVTKFHKTEVAQATAAGGDWDLRPKFAIEAEEKRKAQEEREKRKELGLEKTPPKFTTTFPPRRPEEDLAGQAEDLRLPLDPYTQASTADFLTRKAEKLVDSGLPRMELNFRPLGTKDRVHLGQTPSKG